MKNFVSKIIFVDNSLWTALESLDMGQYLELKNPPPDTKVVSLSNSTDLDELLNSNAVDAGQIKAGNIVIKSPYRENHYIPLSEISEDIVVRKYSIFNTFCLSLGSKRVSVTHIESNDFMGILTENTNVDGSLKAPLGELKGEFRKGKSKTSADSIAQRVGLISEAEGGPPDIEKAKSMIKKYGLQNDSLFESLLESRELANNRLLSKEFLIDTSKDLEKIFDSSMSARIDLISKIYSVGGGVNKSHTTTEKNLIAFQLRVKVEF